MADHENCEEVKVLSDIVHDMKLDCNGLKTVLHDLKQQGESLLEHEHKHEELVSDIERRALSSLQNIKQKLLDMYAQLEKEVLSAIAEQKKVISEKIKSNNEKINQFLNDIKLQSTNIENVEKFKTNEHVVLLQRQLEKDSVGCLKSTVGELLNNRSKRSFKSVEDTSFDSLLIEMRNSLRIEDVTCDVNETGSDTDNIHDKAYTERTAWFKCTKDLNNIPMFDLEKRIDPSSCIWIEKYIVTNLRTGKALLVIREDSNFVLSKFNCDYMPWSISKTGPTDMVITFPDAYTIAFAQLRLGNVHVVTELKTRLPYHDVTRNAPLNQYICMSSENGQIDILHNDGTLLREISLSPDIKECAQSFNSFCKFNAYSHNIIISNAMSNKVMALDLNGEKVFEYKSNFLQWPGQIAVDPCGNVYVTSYYGHIHQISPSGQYSRSFFLWNDSSIPFGICFNSTFDKIALTSLGNPDLRVYEFA